MKNKNIRNSENTNDFDSRQQNSYHLRGEFQNFKPDRSSNIKYQKQVCSFLVLTLTLIDKI